MRGSAATVFAFLLLGTASAQVNIIGWSVPLTPGSHNPAYLANIMPNIDGVTIPIGWASTDMTTCGSSSCNPTYSFTNFEASIVDYIYYSTPPGAASTCGGNLPGRPIGGHVCIINIDAQPVSNPVAPNYNIDTPCWVFSSNWSNSLPGPPPLQDAGFCTGYPGSTPPATTPCNPPPPSNPAPPTTATTTNASISNCGAGSTLCTPATVATGVPAIWETPFVTAVNGWRSSLITWASGRSWASQIGYIRFGFSIGSEATTTCAQVLEGLLSGGGDSALKAKWTGAYADAASYISGQRAALSPVPVWVPLMTINMGQGLTSGTDPSWAIAEAQTIIANQPFALGSQGLKNGKVGGVIDSDLINIQNGATCTGTNCCSNNWCNTRPFTVGRIPFIEIQDCNVSTPAGGSSGCLSALLANTATTDAATLSQVFVLSSQHGTTSAEIYLKDLECAFEPSVLTGASCVTDPTISPAYQAAIMALASGQPSGTGALIGTSQTVGGVYIF